MEEVVSNQLLTGPFQMTPVTRILLSSVRHPVHLKIPPLVVDYQKLLASRDANEHLVVPEPAKLVVQVHELKRPQPVNPTLFADPGALQG